MSLLLKDLLAAGIGYETASAIANATVIKDNQHTTVSTWYDLVDFCIESPGILNDITGYKSSSKLAPLFTDEEIIVTSPAQPPSEDAILEKIIRWAYYLPKHPTINMNPFVLAQLFPRAEWPIKKKAWLPIIPYYCRHCHEYQPMDVISQEQTLERGGYNYMLVSGIETPPGMYLSCKVCYPVTFEGLGSLFG